MEDNTGGGRLGLPQALEELYLDVGACTSRTPDEQAAIELETAGVELTRPEQRRLELVLADARGDAVHVPEEEVEQFGHQRWIGELNSHCRRTWLADAATPPSLVRTLGHGRPERNPPFG
jgi:hypothetical protein